MEASGSSDAPKDAAADGSVDPAAAKDAVSIEGTYEVTIKKKIRGPRRQKRR